MGLSSILGAYILTGRFVNMYPDSAGTLAAALAGFLLVGAVIGAINGFSVVILKMPSFMSTIATQLLFSGMALYISNSQNVGNLPAHFKYIANGKIAGVPVLLLITVVVVILCHFALSKTEFGRNVYAIGINPRTSLISGLPVRKIIFSLFFLCGCLAALSAVITTGRLGAGMPALNKERMLDIVAAVIIGGTSPYGGKGNILGTVLAFCSLQYLIIL
jgi:ribose/xylose/arabinose/galactoside ABC-type transport system permease subunit